MSGLSFWIIDLETNGLSSLIHECTEISIIRMSDRVQLWRNIKCEHPERSSIDALRVTGKTIADLSNGYSKEQVVAECDKFFNEDRLTPTHRCIIGHNIFSFDKKFLHALWASVGKTFPAVLWADTLPMMKFYIKKIGLDKECKEKGLPKPRVNLGASCDLLGIKKAAGQHNARSDSRNSYFLWKHLIEEKNIDYLPFIKTAAHTTISDNSYDDELDILDDI